MIIAKAIVGSLIAGLGAAGTALVDSQITALEWVTIASAALVAFAGVWSVPNTPMSPGGKHEPKDGVVAYDWQRRI